MRYIMSAVWAVLVSLAVTYVLTSMAGEPFTMEGVLLLAALFFLATVFMGDGVLKEKKE